MSENQNQQGVKGILLSITESGRVTSQVMGTLNEAEFLGLGAYLSNVLMKDGILTLSRNQIAEMEALDKIAQALEMMMTGEREEEICGKESCSDCSPSEDSGQSSEGSQDQSNE